MEERQEREETATGENNEGQSSGSNKCIKETLKSGRIRRRRENMKVLEVMWKQ